MRKCFQTLGLILLFITATATKEARATHKSLKAVVKTNIYCDHCKQCASCGQRLYDAIHQIPGVKRVKIEPEKNEIHVKYDETKTNLEDIREVISRSGFDADDLHADPAAYESLDGCCKK